MSIVMAVYNGEPYLEAALDSVRAQTFPDYEFIVIDDCSTDSTAEILAAYGDERLVYIRNEHNIGQTRSLNKGLEHARAPLIARIDADDIFFPEKLERQLTVLAARPDITVLGTACRIIDEDGRDKGFVTPPRDGEEVLFRLCFAVPLVHISAVMRTAALRAVGGYDPAYRYAQDYALWSAFARAGYRIANLREPLAAFRAHSASLNTINKLGAASEETCRIAQRNARDFASLELSLSDCRAVDLLMYPEAGLDLVEVVGAFRTLKALARGVWRRIPIRIRVILAARLVWAVSKAIEYGRVRGTGTEVRRRILTFARQSMREPDVVAGLLTAWALAGIGYDRVSRLKAAATRVL